MQTLILIHGYGFDCRTFEPLGVAFEGFRVVYFSLPGFGDQPAERPYSIESLAQQFWSSIGPDAGSAVHLAGHSMGGYVCMEMVAQQPARVASLTLIHSHVFADPEEKKLQRTSTMEHIQLYGRDAFVRRMIPSLFASVFNRPETVEFFVDRGLGYPDGAWIFGAQAMRDRKDHSETLKNIHVPVLMISGQKDMAMPQELFYKQAHLPERNCVHIYPGVGHMSMYEATELLSRDLLLFYTQFNGG